MDETKQIVLFSDHEDEEYLNLIAPERSEHGGILQVIPTKDRLSQLLYTPPEGFTGSNTIRFSSIPPISTLIDDNSFESIVSRFYPKPVSKQITDEFSGKYFSTAYFKGGVSILRNDLILLDDKQSLNIQVNGKELIFVKNNELAFLIDNNELRSDAFILQENIIKNPNNPSLTKQSGDVVFIHQGENLLVFLIDETKAFYRKIYKRE